VAARLGVMSDESPDDHLVEDHGEEAVDEAEAGRRREAAMARIVQFGDPLLKSRSSEVEQVDEELRETIDRMVPLMHDAVGTGLAAPQIGVLRRFIVYQADAESEPRALINPELEWFSEETETSIEGCLSIPGILLDIDRPARTRVRALDTDGQEVVIEASGHEARVIQHEVDHLDGVLILDRADRRQRRAALRALRRGETYVPPREEDPPVGEAVAGSTETD
jgi:peptide deformylase